MLLSNIPWVAPDRMAFITKLHEQANKTQMNRQQKKAKYTSIKQRKAIILYSVASADEAQR